MSSCVRGPCIPHRSLLPTAFQSRYRHPPLCNCRGATVPHGELCFINPFLHRRGSLLSTPCSPHGSVIAAWALISKTTKTSRGLGLNHMRARLKLVKGSFSVTSQPKRGATIHARVPLSLGSDFMG